MLVIILASVLGCLICVVLYFAKRDRGRLLKPKAKKAETTSLAGFVEVADEREISKELEARAQRRRELGAAAVDDEEHDDLGINPIFLQAQQQLENGAGGKKKVRERVAFVFGRGGGKGALGRLEQYSQTKLKNPKPQPSGPPPNKKGGTSSRSKVADSQPRATASQEVHERSDQVNMTLSQQRMRRSTHIVSENY